MAKRDIQESTEVISIDTSCSTSSNNCLADIDEDVRMYRDERPLPSLSTTQDGPWDKPSKFAKSIVHIGSDNSA